MPDFESRVRGVLYGTAYGDALGAPVEHLSHAEIMDHFGHEIETVRTPWYKESEPAFRRHGRVRGHGVITDDTLMTIALVHVYNEVQRHLDAYDMADGMIREIAYRQRYIPEFDRVGMIAERLFYAEKHIFNRLLLAHCDPREGGYGNAVNCGAAMYIAPVGMVNAGRPRAAYDEAISFAMAHQLSYGLEAAGVLAACVAEACRPGASVETLIGTALSLAKDGTREAIAALAETARVVKPQREDHPAVIRALHAAILPYSPIGDETRRPESQIGKPLLNFTPSRFFSIEELPISLAYLLIWDDDPAQAVIRAVNSGRDADSIGVMTAALAGALHGDSIFDPAELETVDRRSQLHLAEEAAAFARTARGIQAADAERMHGELRMMEAIRNA